MKQKHRFTRYKSTSTNLYLFGRLGVSQYRRYTFCSKYVSYKQSMSVRPQFWEEHFACINTLIFSYRIHV